MRTSQKGRIRMTIPRMRPIMALKSASGKPVTATRVRTGFPSPPKATGAELATRQRSAVCSGGKPNPISMAPVTATGAPPPPAPSSSAPNAKAISSTCRRRSARYPADGLLDDLELSGLHRNVVNENRRHQDPGDSQPAVHQAIGHGARGHVHRHMEDAQGYGDPDGERIHRREPRGGSTHCQEIEQRTDRDGSRDGGQHRVA